MTAPTFRDFRGTIEAIQGAWDWEPINTAVLPAAVSTSIRGLYVGTGGTLVLTNKSGVDVPFVNMPDGSLMTVIGPLIIGVGTTAADLVGLY